MINFDLTDDHGCVVVDVTDGPAMLAAVDDVVARHGRVEVMVNNAGIMPLAFFADHAQAADAWDRCIDVNLKGVVHGISAVYDHMLRQGSGHVVNLASIYGNYGIAGAAVAVGAMSLAAAPAEAAQPAMARGLADLEAAYRALSHGLPDKAGHRVKAMALIQQAIAEVKAGMVAGAM